MSVMTQNLPQTEPCQAVIEYSMTGNLPVFNCTVLSGFNCTVLYCLDTFNGPRQLTASH